MSGSLASSLLLLLLFRKNIEEKPTTALSSPNNCPRIFHFYREGFFCRYLLLPRVIERECRRYYPFTGVTQEPSHGPVPRKPSQHETHSPLRDPNPPPSSVHTRRPRVPPTRKVKSERAREGERPRPVAPLSPFGKSCRSILRPRDTHRTPQDVFSR